LPVLIALLLSSAHHFQNSFRFPSFFVPSLQCSDQRLLFSQLPFSFHDLTFQSPQLIEEGFSVHGATDILFVYLKPTFASVFRLREWTDLRTW